jgi:thiol-disulfide isomerase/thioredoxin
MRRWIVATWLLVLFSPAAEARKIRVVLKPATAAELKVNLRAVNGRPRFVHLWATWCMPCVAERPQAKSCGLLPNQTDQPEFLYQFH